MKYSLPITLLSPWYPSAIVITRKLELCSGESTKVNSGRLLSNGPRKVFATEPEQAGGPAVVREVRCRARGGLFSFPRA